MLLGDQTLHWQSVLPCPRLDLLVPHLKSLMDDAQCHLDPGKRLLANLQSIDCVRSTKDNCLRQGTYGQDQRTAALISRVQVMTSNAETVGILEYLPRLDS